MFDTVCGVTMAFGVKLDQEGLILHAYCRCPLLLRLK